MFLAKFRNVRILLLITAGAISLALWFHERDTTLTYDALVIFAIVLFNGILGYFQESRAERSVAALRAMAAADASVVRDGQPKRVPAAELVPARMIAGRKGSRSLSGTAPPSVLMMNSARQYVAILPNS
ncbi:MAG: hypothetical protein IPG61_16165 [bacterium]|nr:hypothetical protein [bacterium]